MKEEAPPTEREKDPTTDSPSAVRKDTTPLETLPLAPEVVRRTREGVCWGGVDASDAPAVTSVCILDTSPGVSEAVGRGERGVGLDANDKCRVRPRGPPDRRKGGLIINEKVF